MARDNLTLVTGASGFVGAAVARALAARGHPLRLLVRGSSIRKHLTDLPAEFAEGDLNDSDSLARAVKDCRYVFHVAADYRIWVPNPEAMIATNVQATENLLRLAYAAGVERIIYTSSVAALGLNPKGGPPATENTPITYDKVVGTYKKSKFLAEQMALKLSDEGIPVVIVNPAAPIGPGDVKPTPTGVMIRDAALGRMPAYVDTGLSVVHVDDCAAGHLMALDHGEIGERYILGGQNIPMSEVLGLVDTVVGKTSRRVRLPIAPLMPAAVIAEQVARVTGKEPRLTRDHLKMAKKMMYFSSAKAEQTLGYTYRPAIEAVRDAILWFEQHGYLKA
ncbi:hopanoid-associated sugar epimerase [Acidisoma silvae]|uniref:hopanoid-associated sugar epimerase n=1 Tax=Acidisoma silvae TaxID=2802396 RepID=UPI001D0BB03D|nr:hopanoid-associated sugar epimerase [Acidisoma silvae]